MYISVLISSAVIIAASISNDESKTQNRGETIETNKPLHGINDTAVSPVYKINKRIDENGEDL